VAVQDGCQYAEMSTAVATGSHRWRSRCGLGLLLFGIAVSGKAVTGPPSFDSPGRAFAQGQAAVCQVPVEAPAQIIVSISRLTPSASEGMPAPAEMPAAGGRSVASAPLHLNSSAESRTAQTTGGARPPASSAAQDARAQADAKSADAEEIVWLPPRALMLSDAAVVINELPQPVAMPINDRLYPSHSLAIEITDLAGACYIQAESGQVQLNGRTLKIGQPCLVQPGAVVTWSEDSGIRFSPGSHPGNIPANG
jgi:hypothetical protein